MQGLTKYTARDFVGLAAVSLAVSTLGVISAAYVQGNGTYSYTLLQTVISIAAFAIAFAAIACSADFLCGKRIRTNRFADAVTPNWSKRSISLFAVIMIVFWLPWLIANFPGQTDFDTYWMMSQFHPEIHPGFLYPSKYFSFPTEAAFVDQHPVFDTMIFGIFAYVSDILTGSWNAGIFTYVAIQGAATAFALSASLAFLKKNGCPGILLVCAMAFFCLMPFCASFAFRMCKDSLFGLLFIPYFMMLFTIVRSKGEWLQGSKRIAWFIVIGLLLCLTKKTGLYIMLPTAIFLALRFRKTWLPALIQALSGILLMLVVLPFVVFPLIGAVPGGSQEAIGLLLQQTAAYSHKHGDAASEEDVAAVGHVVDYESAGIVYEYDSHDPVKGVCKPTTGITELSEYLQAWARMGAEDPETYASALFGVGGRFLSPTSQFSLDVFGTNRSERYIESIYTDAKPLSDKTVIEYPEQLSGFRNGLHDFWKAVAGMPIVGILLQMVLYIFWIPSVAWFVNFRRKLGAGALLVPLLICLAFCVIGPAFSVRYCVCSLYTVPLLLCMIYCLANPSQKEGVCGLEATRSIAA